MVAGASNGGYRTIMKAAVLALILLVTLGASPPPAFIEHADVLIQAGHEGRPASCALFPLRACNLGAKGEREATPTVADEAARVLRAAGLRVVRVPADYRGHYAVEAAIFIHFDGAEPACTTGASIGYPVAGAAAARAWRALYAPLFPFRFMPDNFTEGLAGYYGYHSVEPNATTLLLELAEISCPAQHAWAAARYKWLGRLIAHFVSARIGKGNVPQPARWRRS